MEIKKMFNARQIDYKQGEKVTIRRSPDHSLNTYEISDIKSLILFTSTIRQQVEKTHSKCSFQLLESNFKHIKTVINHLLSMNITDFILVRIA